MPCSEKTSFNRLREALKDCKAVVAGAGLSVSAGFVYTGERRTIESFIVFLVATIRSRAFFGIKNAPTIVRAFSKIL